MNQYIKNIEASMADVFARTILESLESDSSQWKGEIIEELFGQRNVTYLTEHLSGIVEYVDSLEPPRKIFANNLISELTVTCLISNEDAGYAAGEQLCNIFRTLVEALRGSSVLTKEYASFYVPIEDFENADISGIVFFLASNALLLALEQAEGE